MADDAFDAAGGATPAALFRGTLRWVIAFVLLGAVAGATAGFLRSDATSATATILVTPIAGNAFSPGGRGDDLLNLLTEAELVSSDAVAGAVAEREGGGATIGQALSGLQVEVPTNTQLITITYEASSKDRAIERSQAFAEAFLGFRENRAQSAINTQVDRIENQIKVADGQLRDLVQQSGSGTASQQALTRERIEGVTAYLVVLQTQLSESRAASTYPGQIVTPSSANFERSLSGPPLYAGAGAVLGFALGLLVAIFRARNTRIVRHVEDVVASGPKLLADLPRASVAQVLASMEEHHTSDIVLSEEFRELRAAVLYEAKGAPQRLMLATSDHRDPKVAPVSALGLALAFARTGLSVVVVDGAFGDPNGPTAVLGLSKNRGLTEALNGKPWEPLLFPIEPSLRFLPLGSVIPGLDDLLVSQRMATLLKELEADSDVVIVVTGTVHHSRSRELAALAGPVLVEVSEGHATFGEVASLVDFEGGASRGLLGVVFVRRKGTRRKG